MLYLAVVVLLLHGASGRVAPLPPAHAMLSRGAVVVCAFLALDALLRPSAPACEHLLLIPAQAACLLLAEDFGIKWASRFLGECCGLGLRPGGLGCASLFSLHSPLEAASALDLGAGGTAVAVAVFFVRPAGTAGVALWLALRHAEGIADGLESGEGGLAAWLQQRRPVEAAVACLQSHGDPSNALVLAAVPYLACAGSGREVLRLVHYALLAHSLLMVLEKNSLFSSRAVAATLGALAFAKHAPAGYLPSAW